MGLKYLYLLESVDIHVICMLMIMKTICWYWLTVGSWIMFLVFLIKLFVDLNSFPFKSGHVRFLQDFIVWPKRLAPKRLRPNRQTELARPKSHVPETTWLVRIRLCRLVGIRTNR